jgi:hypothetical protein
MKLVANGVTPGATSWSEPVLRKEVDPPGGTTGRVGYDTGWMRRPRRTQYPYAQFDGAFSNPVRVTLINSG